MSVMDEIAAEVAAAPDRGSADSLQRLTAMAEEAKRLRMEIDDHETQMKAKNTRLWEIKTKEMVDLMDEAKVPSITVGNETFEVETQFKANIPEEKREEGHAWLEQVGAGALIDNTIIVAFPKDSDKSVKALLEHVQKEFPKAKSVEVRKMVPWARLTSWFKSEYTRRLEPDETRLAFPMDTLGASVTRIVTLASEKKRRGRKDD